jgi:hypothetical protein
LPPLTGETDETTRGTVSAETPLEASQTIPYCLIATTGVTLPATRMGEESVLAVIAH